MGNIHLPFCYVIFEVADQGDLRQMLALRRFHTVDIRVAEAGAGTLA